MTEELLRRAVQDGPAQGILAAHLLNQVFHRQGMNGIVALDPADFLHLGLGHRLAVGHHGKGFHGRLGQALLLHGLQKAHHIVGIQGAGSQLHLPSEALQAEAPLLIVILVLQFLQGLLHLTHGQIQRPGQLVQAHRFPCHKQDGLNAPLQAAFLTHRPAPPPCPPAVRAGAVCRRTRPPAPGAFPQASAVPA